MATRHSCFHFVIGAERADMLESMAQRAVAMPVTVGASVRGASSGYCSTVRAPVAPVNTPAWPSPLRANGSGLGATTWEGGLTGFELSKCLTCATTAITFTIDCSHQCGTNGYSCSHRRGSGRRVTVTIPEHPRNGTESSTSYTHPPDSWKGTGVTLSSRPSGRSRERAPGA
jgi:hypothetical protein